MASTPKIITSALIAPLPIYFVLPGGVTVITNASVWPLPLVIFFVLCPCRYTWYFHPASLSTAVIPRSVSVYSQNFRVASMPIISTSVLCPCRYILYFCVSVCGVPVTSVLRVCLQSELQYSFSVYSQYFRVASLSIVSTSA